MLKITIQRMVTLVLITFNIKQCRRCFELTSTENKMYSVQNKNGFKRFVSKLFEFGTE